LASLEYLGPICRLGLQAGDIIIDADIRSDQLGPLGIGNDRPIPMMIPPDRILVFAGV
jgi:hypothetical protein